MVCKNWRFLNFPIQKNHENSFCLPFHRGFRGILRVSRVFHDVSGPLQRVSEVLK